jgi:hypothetical protein
MRSVESPSDDPATPAYTRLEQAWRRNEAFGAELLAAPPTPDTIRGLEEFAQRRRILYVHLLANRERQGQAVPA